MIHCDKFVVVFLFLLIFDKIIYSVYGLAGKTTPEHSPNPMRILSF